MVLLHDVVEIFDLSNHYRDLPAGIDFINRSFVGATFIHGDFFRDIVIAHGLVKKTPGSSLVALRRQEKVIGNRILLISSISCQAVTWED